MSFTHFQLALTRLHTSTFPSHKSCSFFIYKRIILVLFIRFLPLMGFKCPRPACETYCMHHLIKSYKCSDKLCSVIFREFLTACCANSRKFVGISFSPQHFKVEHNNKLMPGGSPHRNRRTFYFIFLQFFIRHSLQLILMLTLHQKFTHTHNHSSFEHFHDLISHHKLRTTHVSTCQVNILSSSLISFTVQYVFRCHHQSTFSVCFIFLFAFLYRFAQKLHHSQTNAFAQLDSLTQTFTQTHTYTSIVVVLREIVSVLFCLFDFFLSFSFHVYNYLYLLLVATGSRCKHLVFDLSMAVGYLVFGRTQLFVARHRSQR